jgi:EAL domain-containing protein (putative c-di-GMP-specific phosphodiesterase class I)
VELVLHQSFASVAAEDWVECLRERIAELDLIHLRPTIQLESAEALAALSLAGARAAELARLGITLCLTGFPLEGDAESLLESVPCAYVRVDGVEACALPQTWLRAVVEQVHGSGAAVVAGGVDSPDRVAELYPSRIDLIQGPFVQPPMETLGYDFAGGEAG